MDYGLLLELHTLTQATHSFVLLLLVVTLNYVYIICTIHYSNTIQGKAQESFVSEVYNQCHVLFIM